MKKLTNDQMVNVTGGQAAFMTGLLCSATFFLAFSGVLAPLAGATGTGCLVGLAALHYWSEKGIDINK